MANHAEKPEKFSGLHFKRWKQKMFFYLTTLNLARFLKESSPPATNAEGETDVQALSAVDAWKHSEFLCRNNVLNGLVDSLYNVYASIKTAKELWESLEKKYKTEDAGTKKFVVARFLDYKMVDSKTVINQVQELQVILNDIHAEGMTLSETFQVAAVIEKLPPWWIEFKNYLKHKRKEMSMEDLIVRLRIEEDNKVAQKVTMVDASAKANLVEHGQSSKGGKQGKGNGGKGKAKNEPWHKERGCEKEASTFPRDMLQLQWRGALCQPMQGTKARAHMVDEDGNPLVAMITEEAAVIEEVNIVGGAPKGWYVDTGATRHVCGDKQFFKNFKEAGVTKSFIWEIMRLRIS
ncbi:uncharacterized protein LOC143539088 [Bidens hawaiensis]|uniref:uncharacterized protein LOC143539088 n=1 Tax=Bidens hawaiensis TaxID=980011 RepID=UPI00404A99A3